MSNLPVSDLIHSPAGGEKAASMLLREAKRLETAGCDLLVLACNTMHLFTDAIRGAVSVPFLSMIETVVQDVVNDRCASVGLLGSTTTIESGLYRRPLEQHGVACVVPSDRDQHCLTRVVERVIAGTSAPSDPAFLCSVCKALQRQGAEAVILGCTELPLLLRGETMSFRMYDSLQMLAEAAARQIYSSGALYRCTGT